MSTYVYSSESDKSVDEFVGDFSRLVSAKGFVVHNESKMAMKDIFCAHEQQMPEDFDLHMIQICKPEKAAKSLQKNLERAVLMPKFVMAFSVEGRTQVRMLRYGQDLVTDLLRDQDFSVSIQETFNTLTGIIEEAL